MPHLVEKKPPFVQSDSVQNCHNCETVFIDSRINCRACGYVFCDECSKNRICLPYLPVEKPQNVCDSCLKKIQGLGIQSHQWPLYTTQSNLQYEAEIGYSAPRCCRCTEKFKGMVHFCNKCKRAFCAECLGAGVHHKNKANICENCKVEESNIEISTASSTGSNDSTNDCSCCVIECCNFDCCDLDCCDLECCELECCDLDCCDLDCCGDIDLDFTGGIFCCLCRLICSALEEE
ncbi:uncharacterized protein LOC120330079 [Styela clava]